MASGSTFESARSPSTPTRRRTPSASPARVAPHPAREGGMAAHRRKSGRAKSEPGAADRFRRFSTSESARRSSAERTRTAGRTSRGSARSRRAPASPSAPTTTPSRRSQPASPSAASSEGTSASERIRRYHSDYPEGRASPRRREVERLEHPKGEEDAGRGASVGRRDASDRVSVRSGGAGRGSWRKQRQTEDAGEGSGGTTRRTGGSREEEPAGGSVATGSRSVAGPRSSGDDGRVAVGVPSDEIASVPTSSSASIETPSPAKVRELKRRLWDRTETLRVSAPPHAAFELERSGMRPSPPRVRSTPSSPTTRKGGESPTAVGPRSGRSPATSPRSGRSPATSPGRSGGSRPSTSPTASPKRRFQSKFYRAALASRAGEPANDSDLPRMRSRDAGGENHVASLVAELNAVRRDDPEAALAQIDSILRRESVSSGESQDRVGEMPPVPGREEEDGDSDDETSVSSITNPTYQSAPVVKRSTSKAAQRRQLLQQYPPPTTIKVKGTSADGTEEEKKEEENDVKQPSTPPRRGPRSYTPRLSSPKQMDESNGGFWSLSQQAEDPPSQRVPSPASSSKRSTSPVDAPAADEAPALTKRTSLTKPAPSPSMIIEDADDAIQRAPTPTDAIRMPRSTTPVKRAPSPQDKRQRIPTSPVAAQEKEQRIPMPAKKKSTERKLDKYMANSAALAEKIRAWDELSSSVGRHSTKTAQRRTPMVDQKSVATSPALLIERQVPAQPAQPDLSSKSKPRPKLEPIQSSKVTTPQPNRPHPWDSSIPVRCEKTQMKDTSMDNAAGVEVAIEKRPVEQRSASPLSFDISKGEEGMPPNSKPYCAPSPMLETTEETSPPSSPARSPATNLDVDLNLFDDMKHSESSTWDVPAHVSERQQENAMNLSDDFDEAWVALPANSFFPKEAPTPPRKNKSVLGHSAVTASELTNRSPTPIIPFRKKYPSVEEKVVSTGAASAPNTPQKAIPMRRAKSFSQRERPKPAGHSIMRTVSGHSPGEPSPDQSSKPAASTAVTSSKATTTTTSSSKKRGFLRNAFKRKNKKGPLSEARSREPSASPIEPRGREEMTTPSSSHSRSKSNDGFRSARMAQKFSRVMKLYDQDQ